MFNQKLEAFKGMKTATALTAVIMAGTGFFLIFNHLFIVPLFCAAVTASGIIFILRYITAKDKRMGWDLITGIAHILFGIIMLSGGPETKAYGVLLIESCLAAWLIFSGVMNIGLCFGGKREDGINRGWIIAGGILSVIAGIVFFNFPLMSALIATEVAGLFIGIILMVSGLTLLAAALSGKNALAEENSPELKEREEIENLNAVRATAFKNNN